MRNLKYLFIFFILVSCEDEIYIPKPPTYLRLELPAHKYEPIESDCPYQFDISGIYKIEKVPDDAENSCHRRINLGALNGMAFIRYWDMTEPLSYYINNANDEVDRHKIKATNIRDKNILKPEKRVFGTFFELEGDVATPFQFYLTDSTNRFLYCEILFNSTPNYDSLKPSLEYLKIDLDTLMSTFEWTQ
jgi:gliding motility-associated lipoprotein GldD